MNDEPLAAHTMTAERFAYLYEQHRAMFRKYARSLAGSDCEDLLQQSLLKAWTYRTRFTDRDESTDFRRWVMTIMRNEFVDLRRSKRRSSHCDELTDIETPENPASQEHAVELAETLAILRKAPPLRRAMIMSAALGWSYEEIAEPRQMALGTVRSRLSRGRAWLALAQLQQHGRLAGSVRMGTTADKVATR